MPTEELIKLADKPFTAKEKELVIAMTKPDATIEVVVPEDINPQAWMSATSVTCRVLLRAQMQEQQLLPVLGRLLLIAQENPSIYTENGYEGYDAFQQAEIVEKWGVSRGTCYEAKRYARFSISAKLTPDDYKEIGRVNMRELVKAIPEEDAGKAATRKLIEKAKELPVKEFRAHLDEKLHVEPGSTTGAWCRFGCSKAFLKRFETFCADPDIQATAGSGDPSRIIDRMMEYCMAEFKNKGAAKLEAQEAAAGAA